MAKLWPLSAVALLLLLHVEVDAQQLDVPVRNVATNSKHCDGQLTSLEAGARPYCDSDFAFTDLPSFLEGTTLIQTAVADVRSDSEDPEFLCFDTTQASTVYLLVDNGVEGYHADPAWMQTSFPNTYPPILEIATFEEPQTGEQGHFDIRYNNFDEAERVCLGGNHAIGNTGHMYVVAVGPLVQESAGSCDLISRTAAVNAECCDEATEDCSTGIPQSCNAGCARILLPFSLDCTRELGEEGAQLLQSVVTLCDTAVGAAPETSSPCTLPYETLDDAWRRAESGFSEDNKHSDHEPVYGFRHIAWSPTGGRWFRITGAAGNALARADPGKEHCGTTSPGWLSAWNPSSGDPPKTYNIPGDYPVPSDGTVDMTVCFDAEGMASAMTDADFSCKSHTTISVRNCDNQFYLWMLPSVPTTDAAYCTATASISGH